MEKKYIFKCKKVKTSRFENELSLIIYQEQILNKPEQGIKKRREKIEADWF